MTAEQDGLYRVGLHYNIHVYQGDRPVATFHDAGEARRFVGAVNATLVAVEQDDLDPTPAARCSQRTPFEALSEPTCTRPEGHEGAHLFTSYDGKTPLKMMPK